MGACLLDMEPTTYRTRQALASEMLISVRGRLAAVPLRFEKKLTAPNHQH